MATGGSVPSTSSFSLPPPVKEPTETHENPHHGGIPGDMAGQESSDVMEKDCVGPELELPDDMAGQDSSHDSKDNGQDYFVSQFELLSGCINQSLTKTAVDVRERYFKDIKDLIGDIASDDAIDYWMDNLEIDILTDADPNDGSDERVTKANKQRMQHAELNDLAVLFLKAPINSKCPVPEYLTASATSKRCKAFLADKRATDQLMLITCQKQKGKRKKFRTIKYALHELRFKAILEDQQFANFDTIPESVDFVKSEWKLVVLHAGLESKTTEKGETTRCLGWRSQDGSGDLFQDMCKQIQKLYNDFEKDQVGRQLIADSYMKLLNVPKKTKLTTVEITSKRDVNAHITQFMNDDGTKSKMVLVVYSGHGTDNGDICLRDHVEKQMTFFDALHRYCGEQPRLIDMVWACCNSYLRIEEQEKDSRIQVIQRHVWQSDAYRFEPVPPGSLRSFHLTCKDHPKTCYLLGRINARKNRGCISSAYSDNLHTFAKEQNKKNFGKGSDMSSSETSIQSTSTQDTKQPSAIMSVAKGMDDLYLQKAKLTIKRPFTL